MPEMQLSGYAPETFAAVAERDWFYVADYTALPNYRSGEIGTASVLHTPNYSRTVINVRPYDPLTLTNTLPSISMTGMWSRTLVSCSVRECLPRAGTSVSILLDI